MQTEVLKVRGMSGEGCVDKIGTALKTIKGVSDVDVSLAGGRATVQFDEQLTSKQELQATLARTGYSIEPEGHGNGSCCGGCGGN
ncbi:MAG TPA: heavy-metal-associated domain-containing protein [Burkholderiaceae bacterium]|nr:heavy-metal-associated domain-containing protein [Burkholderiaceae bacterium]